MTKAEFYYKRRYNELLREFNNPATVRIEIKGKPVTPEEAAKHGATHDLKVYKMGHSKIQECCADMAGNQSLTIENDEEGDPIRVLGNYKNTDGPPIVVIAGNIIHYCPFCGTRIVVLPYVDEEYVPPSPIDNL